MFDLFAWTAVLSLACLGFVFTRLMLSIRDKASPVPPLWARSPGLALPSLKEQRDAEKATAGLYRSRMPQERPAEPERIIIGGRPERLKEP